MADQCISVFLADACQSQAACVGVAQIVDPHVFQIDLCPGVLKSVVIHRADAVATVGEHEIIMLATLRLDDTPRGIVEDDDMADGGLVV